MSELQVAPRQVLGKNVRKLRREGVTPANVYGHGVESKAVQAPTVDVTRLLRGLTKNAIVNLQVTDESAPRTVVVRNVERDPLNGRLVHIDFFQVSMTEKMRARVPVVLTGTSDAVSTYGGVLLQTLEAIDVEALPGDIPAEFTVDVSVLTELEQSVHVRDLHLEGGKVHIFTDPDVVLARVAAPRLATAEEEAAAAGEPEEGAGPAPEEGAPAPEPEAAE
jgi:large subunit ribosomal protein L25